MLVTTNSQTRVNCKHCISDNHSKCIKLECLCRITNFRNEHSISYFDSGKYNKNSSDLIQAFTKKASELLPNAKELKNILAIENRVRSHLIIAERFEKNNHKSGELYEESLDFFHSKERMELSSDYYYTKLEAQTFNSEYVNDIVLPCSLPARVSCGNFGYTGHIKHCNYRIVRKNCRRRGCCVCGREASKAYALKIVDRVIAGKFLNDKKSCADYTLSDDRTNRKINHGIITVSPQIMKLYENKKDRPKLRKKIKQILMKYFNFQGVVIFDHPYRFEKKLAGIKNGTLSPHFHYIGTGYADFEKVKELFKSTNGDFRMEFLSVVNDYETLLAKVNYLLSHTAVFVKNPHTNGTEHGTRYLGILSNSKFKTSTTLSNSVSSIQEIRDMIFDKDTKTVTKSYKGIKYLKIFNLKKVESQLFTVGIHEELTDSLISNEYEKLIEYQESLSETLDTFYDKITSRFLLPNINESSVKYAINQATNVSEATQKENDFFTQYGYMKHAILSKDQTALDLLAEYAGATNRTKQQHVLISDLDKSTIASNGDFEKQIDNEDLRFLLLKFTYYIPSNAKLVTFSDNDGNLKQFSCNIPIVDYVIIRFRVDKLAVCSECQLKLRTVVIRNTDLLSTNAKLELSNVLAITSKHEKSIIHYEPTTELNDSLEYYHNCRFEIQGTPYFDSKTLEQKYDHGIDILPHRFNDFNPEIRTRMRDTIRLQKIKHEYRLNNGVSPNKAILMQIFNKQKSKEPFNRNQSKQSLTRTKLQTKYHNPVSQLRNNQRFL